MWMEKSPLFYLSTKTKFQEDVLGCVGLAPVRCGSAVSGMAKLALPVRL